MIRTRTARSCAVGVLALAIGSGAHAESYTWIGPDGGDWETAAHWSPTGVPGPGDSAIIGDSDEKTFAPSEVSIASSVTVAELRLYDGSDLDILAGATLDANVLELWTGTQPMGGLDFPFLRGGGSVVMGDGLYVQAGLVDTIDLTINGTFLPVGPGSLSGTAGNAITVNGEVLVGSLFGSGAGSMEITSTGLLRFETPDASVELLGGASDGGLVNHGEIRCESVLGDAVRVGNLRTCDGTIHVQSGRLDLVHTGVEPSVVTGPVIIDADATLGAGVGVRTIFSGTTVTGAGTLGLHSFVTLESSDVTGPLVQTLDSAQNLELTITGTCTIGDFEDAFVFEQLGTGTLVVGGDATILGLGIDADATIELHGTTTIQSVTGAGSVDIFGETTMTQVAGLTGAGAIVEPGGTLILDDLGSVSLGAGQNLGTLRKLGSGTTTLATSFTQDGLAEIVEGRLDLAVASTHTGDFTIDADATLGLTDAVTLTAGSVTGDGTLQFENTLQDLPAVVDGDVDVFRITMGPTLGTGGDMNGTVVCDELFVRTALGGTGQVSVLEACDFVSNGKLSDAIVVSVPGTTTISNAANLVDTARLEVAGPLDWQSGNVNGAATARFVVTPDNSVDFLNAVDMWCGFENYGTIRIDTGGTFRFIAPNVSVNTGLLDVAGGTVHFWNGTPAQGLAGAIRLSGGMIQHPNSATLAFDGGLVQGLGSIPESVSLAGTTISPGLSPGELGVTGGVTMDAASAFVVELGGMNPGVDQDVLTVGGNAAVNGTLLVGYLDGYEPAPGDMFTILNAGSVSGAFVEVAGLGEYDVVYHAGSIELVVLDPDVSCQTDVDGDDGTEFQDLVSILAAWGPCGDPCPQDVDGDGVVGFGDLVSTLAAWGPCPENVAFDVTFSSPLHTVGEPPAQGGGPPWRETVSFFVDNPAYHVPPEVSDAVGGLADRPLRMEFGDRLCGVYFMVNDLPAASRWRIEFDLTIQELVDAYLHMSFASFVAMSFIDDRVAYLSYGDGMSQPTFNFDEIISIRVELDFELMTVEIHWDDVLMGSGTLADDSFFPGLQFTAQGNWGHDAPYGLAAIDNVKITAID